MGLFRLLLAIAVVFAHTAPPFGLKMTLGGNSVQAFYIVSGFLITYVLNERYVGALGSFYRARLLRIFPSYWFWAVVTVGSAAVLWGAGNDPIGTLGVWRDKFSLLSLPARAYVVLSNVVLVGQDVGMWVALDADGRTHLAANYWANPVHLSAFAWVPPSWTLGLELSFYAVAPLIVRSTARIVMVLLACLGLRWWLYRLGYAFDPWTYRFFPVELGTFMLGAVSYKLLVCYRASVPPHGLCVATSAVLCALTVGFQWLPTGNTVTILFRDAELIFYGAVVLLLPLAFMASKNRVDRFIGELSYPVYLCHFAAIVIVRAVGVPLPPTAYALTVTAASLVLGVLGYLLVDRPVDRLRHGN